MSAPMKTRRTSKTKGKRSGGTTAVSKLYRHAAFDRAKAPSKTSWEIWRVMNDGTKVLEHSTATRKSVVRFLKTASIKTPRLQSDSVPWREALADRIAIGGEPAAALRGARAKEGLTQVELAKKVGIEQASLSKMETGMRPIGKKMAKRLAEALNVDYRIFL